MKYRRERGRESKRCRALEPECSIRSEHGGGALRARNTFVNSLANVELCNWNTETKLGALANGAFDPQVSGVGLHDVPRDRKAQARAACLA